jgi:hypothetical protein
MTTQFRSNQTSSTGGLKYISKEGVWKFRATVFHILIVLTLITSYRGILQTTLMLEISHFLTLIAANFGPGTISSSPIVIFLIFFFKLLILSQ